VAVSDGLPAPAAPLPVFNDPLITPDNDRDPAKDGADAENQVAGHRVLALTCEPIGFSNPLRMEAGAHRALHPGFDILQRDYLLTTRSRECGLPPSP
jgi:hypothetical protein